MFSSICWLPLKNIGWFSMKDGRRMVILTGGSFEFLCWPALRGVSRKFWAYICFVPCRAMIVPPPQSPSGSHLHCSKRNCASPWLPPEIKLLLSDNMTAFLSTLWLILNLFVDIRNAHIWRFIDYPIWWLIFVETLWNKWCIPLYCHVSAPACMSNCNVAKHPFSNCAWAKAWAPYGALTLVKHSVNSSKILVKHVSSKKGDMCLAAVKTACCDCTLTLRGDFGPWQWYTLLVAL